MAEVRDFSTYAGKLNSRKKSGASDRQTSYREKIRSHKLKVFIRAVAIIVGVTVLTSVIYISWRDKQYSQASTSQGVPVNNGTGTQVVSLNGHIIQYSNDGVSCLDATGKALWNQTYEMQNPKARTCMDTIAIGENNGHEIYVNSISGPMGEVKTEFPIRDFCVSSQGVVAAILDDEDVTHIFLYDAQGNKLANLRSTMKETGYPASISISPNGELLCVAYQNPKDGAVKTSIGFYNFGDVGQNMQGHLASGYDYSEEVVPFVRFMSADKAFAVSNSEIMFYSGKEKPKERAKNPIGEDEIRSVFFSDSYVGLVFAESSEEGEYRLQVYNSTGESVLTTYFDMDYSEIIFSNKQIVIYNEKEFMLKDMNGKVKYQGEFEEPVRNMIPTNTMSSFALVTSNRIDTLSLK